MVCHHSRRSAHAPIAMPHMAFVASGGVHHTVGCPNQSFTVNGMYLLFTPKLAVCSAWATITCVCATLMPKHGPSFWRRWLCLWRTLWCRQVLPRPPLTQGTRQGKKPELSCLAAEAFVRKQSSQRSDCRRQFWGTGVRSSSSQSANNPLPARRISHTNGVLTKFLPTCDEWTSLAPKFATT